jgi:ribonuclease R
LQISPNGELKSWRFSRAVVRIAANIAYEDAQAAIDELDAGRPTTVRAEPVEARLSHGALRQAPGER